MSKVLISIPDDLLADIDREADRAGISRSAFLQGVAREALRVPSHGRIDEVLTQARTALRHAGSFESAGLIRAGRDARDATDRRL
jgi:hypothetical protein